MGNLGRMLMALCAIVVSYSSVMAFSHSADCMKNPFATGCRGISAKRSMTPALLSWQAPFEAGDIYRTIAKQQRQQQSQQQQQQPQPMDLRSGGEQELARVVELLLEATSRLFSPGQLESVQSITRLCSPDGAPGGKRTRVEAK